MMIAYLIIGSLSMINSLCALTVGCCSHFSLCKEISFLIFQVVSCCFFGSSLKSIVLRNVTTHVLGSCMLFFTCFNAVGPVTLLTCGILLATGNAPIHTIGIVSISVGSTLIALGVLSCLVATCVVCCGVCSICITSFDSVPENE
jgi:hypothetical protein